jgi:Ca2+-binding RTX toxin-like protein
VRTAFALVATCLLLTPMGPASAGTISANVVDHILTVTGTGEGDAITIRCEGGEVTVNQSQPDGGPESCSTLRRILVFAEGGADRVSLGEVAPATFGDLANVVVDGGGGDDTLIGSGIGDQLDGGAGSDELRGGGGVDVLSPGPGSGSAIGGKGHDEVSVMGNADWSVNDERIARIPGGDEVTLVSVESIAVAGGRGDNTISAVSFSGSVSASGLEGDDRIATGAKHDHLDGGGGNDYLDSGAGNDLLEGKAGADALRGGEGNDELRGGPGDDTCTGGPGADSELSCS